MNQLASDREPTLLEVLDAMERWGGSFVKALAAAWRKADQTNQTRLIKAFPEYYEAYRYRALEHQLRQEEA